MIWWSIDPQIWWSDDLMIWRSYDLMIYRPIVLVTYWSTALTGALELSTHDSLGRSPIGEHVWRFTGARTLAPLDLLPLIKNIVFMVFAWSLNISHVRLVTAPAKTIVSSHIINSRHFVPPLLTAGEASAAFSPNLENAGGWGDRAVLLACGLQAHRTQAQDGRWAWVNGGRFKICWSPKIYSVVSYSLLL